MKLHPYALIIGVGIGIMVQLSLRYPPFSLFFGIISVVLLDIGIKHAAKSKDEKKDDKE